MKADAMLNPGPRARRKSWPWAGPPGWWEPANRRREKGKLQKEIRDGWEVRSPQSPERARGSSKITGRRAGMWKG